MTAACRSAARWPGCNVPTAWIVRRRRAWRWRPSCSSSLLRTRWRQVKPWKKCALLSLWVHVLLACLATVVQIAVGGPGIRPGRRPGPPIRVALRHDRDHAARRGHAVADVDEAPRRSRAAG